MTPRWGSNIKNRPSHSEIVFSKRFWRFAYSETSKVQVSKRDAQPLNSLPAHPVFEDEKSNGSDEKLDKLKKITGLL